MSKDRIPGDCDKVLLTLFYQDGFCTCQAIWDAVEIERLFIAKKCVMAGQYDGETYYVKRTKGSEKIDRKLTNCIIRKWIAGDYIKVERVVAGYRAEID